MKTRKCATSLLTAATLVLGLLFTGTMEVNAANNNLNFGRTSVHDPSIVADGAGNYYVFGSHMAVSKSTDLMNWSGLYTERTDSTLFGTANADGTVAPSSYEKAFETNAYTGKVKVLIDGVETEVDFGNYNVEDFSAFTGSSYRSSVKGNMWAPDVIYNPTMKKWCMYLSINGFRWNSSIILLTADSIEGPYVYQGPVVFSGFGDKSYASGKSSYKNTDLELVIGTQDSLPAKYNKVTSTKNGDLWGDYYPNAIDPCVFYDTDGKLWMSYGSWSSGIYLLELDENTGLRDYTVTYTDSVALTSAPSNVSRSDAYFGTKIAGGCYSSGEGSYIKKIGNYYYLFMSYGGLEGDGGYNMRVFRSETVNGSYTDASGNSAIYDKYTMNFGSLKQGMKLFGNYKWDSMATAELAQGHNSVLVDSDGRAYVIYHTRFGAGNNHELRVHQLFVNEDGWLVAAPYEYAGETISSTGYAMEQMAGAYGLITHSFAIDYKNKDYREALGITLNADGTVGGCYSGNWAVTPGTPYMAINIDNTLYKGVFLAQQVSSDGTAAMCFTAMSSDGVAIWGSSYSEDNEVVPIPYLEKGETFTEGAHKYVVTGEGKVAYQKYTGSAKKVKIPATVERDGVTYEVTSIAAKAFYGKKITSVVIGANIEKIGKNAFKNCKKLKSITIKTTALTKAKIGKDAFKNTASSAQVKVPKSVWKNYKTILRAKGISKKAKIKKA